MLARNRMLLLAFQSSGQTKNLRLIRAVRSNLKMMGKKKKRFTALTYTPPPPPHPSRKNNVKRYCEGRTSCTISWTLIECMLILQSRRAIGWNYSSSKVRPPPPHKKWKNDSNRRYKYSGRKRSEELFSQIIIDNMSWTSSKIINYWGGGSWWFESFKYWSKM